jgi:cyclopropane fatty-acyl-phospholipid synthase-like methyltransferase
MTGRDPSRIVGEGYDRLDAVYRDWVTRMRGGQRRDFLERILTLIPAGADVLEIGCGPGSDAAALAEGRHYTGIDLSAVQLVHARTAVPDGTFLHADVFDVALPSQGFDAVVAFYVFGHIPAARTSELFERIATWLRPGGWLCASFAVSDDPGSIQPAWLGLADMYFSSVPPAQIDELLGAAGFELRSAETVEEIEPGEGPATFRWVIARRIGGRP